MSRHGLGTPGTARIGHTDGAVRRSDHHRSAVSIASITPGRRGQPGAGVLDGGDLIAWRSTK
jgi:hypothetical protein